MTSVPVYTTGPGESDDALAPLTTAGWTAGHDWPGNLHMASPDGTAVIDFSPETALPVVNDAL